MRSLLSLLFFFSFGIAQYQPNWDSINSRPIPEWYQDAKFGIFIHWGVYSVPSWSPVGNYAEWYWYNLAQGSGNPVYEFHVKTYGANFQYTDFASRFTAELWDPDYWADLFVRSGAKYIVPTSKHHEGFTNWPSSVSWNWNSVDIGPKRDILNDLFTALRARGLKAAMYFSLYEWFHPLYRGADPHSYVDMIMLPQMYDLINTYQPEVFWTDGDWEQTSEFWNSTDFLAWLYNNAPNKDDVVVNDRWGSECRGVNGGFYTAEYSDAYWLDHYWEANRGIDVFSFGLNRASQAGNYTTSQDLIHSLIRTVAFGGNLLLDIGPSWDGQIPVVMQERLLDIGQWLDVNGEAIYGTRAWTSQQEPAPYNSTYYTLSSNGTVNAIFIDWPSDGKLTLTLPVTSPSTQVSFIGYEGQIEWTSSGSSGLVVSLPMLDINTNPSPYAWVLTLNNVK